MTPLKHLLQPRQACESHEVPPVEVPRAPHPQARGPTAHVGRGSRCVGLTPPPTEQLPVAAAPQWSTMWPEGRESQLTPWSKLTRALLVPGVPAVMKHRENAHGQDPRSRVAADGDALSRPV